MFPDSRALARASALISATHALSFYSLTLQHGVPFQPVNIRVNHDPLSLLAKVLDQNANSYTKLDDLITIGRNLVAAGLPSHQADGELRLEEIETESDLASKTKTAERRVILMCIEAALTEHDFDTAYSYLVSRLAPEPSTVQSSSSSADKKSQLPDDDISWRAAYLAGRYRPRDTIKPSIRRLEQRTELLSLALLLAPASALSEVLNVWRRCEEEMSALISQQVAATEHFDDRADGRNMSSIPGGFADPSTEGMVFGQKTREMGRYTAAEEEAPIGLFDVARGAAKAFSRNAFPLRGAATASSARSAAGDRVEDENDESEHERTFSMTSDGGEGRVRKRDMVANAVTGSLASGLGWVLGATPQDS